MQHKIKQEYEKFRLWRHHEKKKFFRYMRHYKIYLHFLFSSLHAWFMILVFSGFSSVGCFQLFLISQPTQMSYIASFSTFIYSQMIQPCFSLFQDDVTLTSEILNWIWFILFCLLAIIEFKALCQSSSATIYILSFSLSSLWFTLCSLHHLLVRSSISSVSLYSPMVTP